MHYTRSFNKERGWRVNVEARNHVSESAGPRLTLFLRLIHIIMGINGQSGVPDPSRMVCA